MIVVYRHPHWQASGWAFGVSLFWAEVTSYFAAAGDFRALRSAATTSCIGTIATVIATVAVFTKTWFWAPDFKGQLTISAAAILARFIRKSIIGGTELTMGSFGDFGWLKFG